MQRRGIVVAIDGPSGSGKSTVARRVATAANLRYLDTGSMYRALTWLALHHDLDLSDQAAIEQLARSATLHLRLDPESPGIEAEGRDLTAAVRSPEVTSAVSAVSAVAGVRMQMVARQRELIGDGGIVVEGRDIGTTVAPDAAVKVFLTASSSARAVRRAQQDGIGSSAVDLSATEADLDRRDALDSSRTASPLAQAPDALVVDSTAMDVDQVVELVTSRVTAALATVTGGGRV